MQRDVTAYIPGIKICHKCLRYGHVKVQCRSKLFRCPRCTENHPLEDCTTPDDPTKFVCFHCSGPQSALSNRCPVFVQSKKVLAEKIRLENSKAEEEDEAQSVFSAGNFELNFPQSKSRQVE